MQSRSPGVHAVTLLHTLFSDTKWTHAAPRRRFADGDRSFDYHDADFMLFGVTAEEIRWLQSGVVVLHVTVRPHRRRQHLRHWARRERRSRTRHCGAPVLSSVRPSSCWASTDICRLWALAQEGSGMSLAVHGTTASTSMWTRPPASTASFSLTIEQRFMRRVAHRVRPCESGCRIHKKLLLPVLVVWAPPRKKRNQEQHALNGNRLPSAAGSPPRSVRQRIDLANDD